MIPIDLNKISIQDFATGLVTLDEVYQAFISADNAKNFIILDKCRNNPFESSVVEKGVYIDNSSQNTDKLRKDNNVMFKPRIPDRLLIAYATSQSDVANDGRSGDYSPYTKELLKILPKPNLSALQMFSEVNQAVSIESQGKQHPWIAYGRGDLFENFYFAN